MLVLPVIVVAALFAGLITGRWLVVSIAVGLWALSFLGRAEHWWGHGLGDGWQFGFIFGSVVAAVAAAAGILAGPRSSTVRRVR